MDNIFDYDSYDTTENFIIETLDEIINKAILKNASDIHIEPFEKTVRIRYRIDGCLHVIKNLDINILDSVISRLKIISSMDISEKRLPQDGNFKFNDQINCRVNTIPTIHGEKAVIRIIYADNKNSLPNN